MKMEVEGGSGRSTACNISTELKTPASEYLRRTKMEGIEVEDPQALEKFDTDVDICATILTRFSNSADEHHLHVCAAIGAMSQELKDQNLPLSAVAYFGATCSSLLRFSTSIETETPGHLVDALVAILSIVMGSLNEVILRKKFDYLSDISVRVLRMKSVGPNGVIPGLKCVAHLLIAVRDHASWDDVAQIFGVLVGYITDDRAKVRKQSHMCLHEVLLRYQMSSTHSPLLAPASESIMKVFERFLLLAGGSNENASEGAKRAQEVLYVLDALKSCLTCLTMKCSTSFLKYFKSLLELRQPHVTRRITDAVNAVCLNSGEVSPEPLLDLLCALAALITSHESSADTMAFTARLLEIGMKRVYSLNRQICVVKLPVVFNALNDILASEHEEATLASVQAYKSLIHACVDEQLIKQGVDRLVLMQNTDTNKTMPTIIEKVCATIGSLIDYPYSSVWDLSLQVVSSTFDKLGQYSSLLFKGTLNSLADMQGLSDDDFPFRKQLHECLGSALGAMGPETFLSLLPLKLDAEDLAEANLWLFPILKQYTVGTKLSFFTESIISMVQYMKQKSAKFEQEGKIYSARSVDGIIYSLWSLLPSFCNYPSDTAKSFKNLEKVLSSALREEPNICDIICAGLQILIHQNKRIAEGKEDFSISERCISEQRVFGYYNAQVASDNLNVLRSSARELLSVLSGVYLKSDKGATGSLLSTISELASISGKEVVSRFFRNTMQKLLKVIQEAGKEEKVRSSSSMHVDKSEESSLSSTRAQLFELAVSLLPGLDSKEIDLLFVATKPGLMDAEGLIQKKAYKVLSIILKTSEEFISTKLEELLNLMIEVLPSCHFSAKRHRLDCLYFLIVHVLQDMSQQNRNVVITSFLTEIMLALKEANKKTRNKAYDILVEIGHACGDEDKGGRRENLHQFFNMVAGGLAGETPHMISAAVKGLARLAYEFSDLLSAAYNVLPATFLLLRRQNKEVIKASLGLLKVLVAKSQADGLETHLRGIVESLLLWQNSSKNHFKAKVKLLLEMLVRKCGLESVKQVMPEEHMKLLTNIRKIKERKERKLASNSEDNRSQTSKATTSRVSRWNHTKIFSDFGHEETENSDTDYLDTKTFAGGRMKKTTTKPATSIRAKRKHMSSAKSLQDDYFDQMEDEPLDLLDRRKARSALRSENPIKRKSETDDDDLEVDSEGRLIIYDEDSKPKIKKHFPPHDSSDIDDTKSKAGSRTSSAAKSGKRRRTSDSSSGWAYTGKEYSSKKGSGDVKRKDKLEPYAYWPLDRKMLSKRTEHKTSARKGMASVVKLTKKLEGKSASHALSIKGFNMKKNKKKTGKRS